MGDFIAHTCIQHQFIQFIVHLKSWVETNTIIKPHECGFWRSRNTLVMVFGLETPETANHTSVVLYLFHATKTTEKQLLIPEFHTPSSPWCCYADGATTSRRPVQQYAWRHWGSRQHRRNRGNPYYTHVVSDIFIPRPDITARLPDSTGQILLVFYEIYRVGDSSRSQINFTWKGILINVRILKWFWQGIFAQISQIRSLYVGNRWSRALDK
jgi:hypothetical protein